jgi:FkbM family methyltransferase
VSADRYAVYVPDHEYEQFRDGTPTSIEVIPESTLGLPALKEIAERLGERLARRAGWILQQLIKIEALRRGPSGSVSLIWDADTVPLKRLEFFHGGRLLFRESDEMHEPYFKALKSLLGIPKLAGKSFVAQCFPCPADAVKNFCNQLEERHGKAWWDAIIDHIDRESLAGFSEYETLGNYLLSVEPGLVERVPANWYRKGYKLFANPNELAIGRESTFVESLPYDYISFESWDTNRAIVRPFVVSKHVLFHYAHRTLELITRKNRLAATQEQTIVAAFLRWFFRQEESKYIVQVGANDGEMCDPLRPFLQIPGDYKAVLVEPLNFYASKLREMYRERLDVDVRQQACGSKADTLSLFSIAPSMADQMDGDGPPNKWAHGQGSFDRKIVEEWIHRNSFRGAAYRERIPEFINSIQEDLVPVKPVAECFTNANPGQLRLLVIDAQGFEYEVLSGLDWANPPDFVICEDDRKSGKKVAKLLIKNGYMLVGGRSDKIFALPNAGQRFHDSIVKRNATTTISKERL